MDWKQLFEMSLQDLIKLAMMDDLVLFCRLWPLWAALIIFIVPLIFVLWKREKKERTKVMENFEKSTNPESFITTTNIKAPYVRGGLWE